ncbi:bifunctional PIG-L family deacetylase/class I SAM-dependent methyltransferase [Sanguibacter keddieii]|uniref:bifunctional PIG-L family deacetylase/class I SAM-dependent methyltransferase n=1 Tax=Sanguibacter keddieii TaxID=60920 RepID=UPI00030BF921|nr:bifunctional PIG-L family deacetylase/class I SAM-dependent methyltransferase [Sanguibacter keddieii]
MSFDHREPGTLETAWCLSGRLDALEPLDLDVHAGRPVTHVVVLAAHPDDETLGAAGLVHRLAATGARVTYVIASDGESSHPGSPTTTSTALARARREEVVAAVDQVAPGAAVHLLGLPDGGLREHRAVLRATLDALVGAASAAVVTGERRSADSDIPPDEGNPSVLVVAPWAGDGHRDHRIAGEVAREVADARGLSLLEYPVWFWHWASPEDPDQPWTSMRRLDLDTDDLCARRRAMSEHRSQVAPLSDQPGDEALLGPEMLQHFDRPNEVFVVHGAGGASAASPPDTARTASDSTPAAAGSTSSLGEEFFDRFYAGKADPWGFESRWYEERKRAVTLASLPRQRFRSALEIGCSTGVLTAELADRSDSVLGVDIAAAPLEAARRRLGGRARFEQLTTPDEWPEGEFDLVVLSEVGYYYGHDDLATMLDRAVGSLASDGVLLLCHWRHPVAEYPLGGDEVHHAALDLPGLEVLVHHEEEDFVLDVLVRAPATSVARETGLL